MGTWYPGEEQAIAAHRERHRPDVDDEIPTIIPQHQIQLMTYGALREALADPALQPEALVGLIRIVRGSQGPHTDVRHFSLARVRLLMAIGDELKQITREVFPELSDDQQERHFPAAIREAARQEFFEHFVYAKTCLTPEAKEAVIRFIAADPRHTAGLMNCMERVHGFLRYEWDGLKGYTLQRDMFIRAALHTRYYELFRRCCIPDAIPTLVAHLLERTKPRTRPDMPMQWSGWERVVPHDRDTPLAAHLAQLDVEDRRLLSDDLMRAVTVAGAIWGTQDFRNRPTQMQELAAAITLTASVVLGALP